MSVPGILMMLAASGARVLKTVSIPGGTTSWTAPATTYRVETVTGQGGPGNAAIPASYTSASVIAATMDFFYPSSFVAGSAGSLQWGNYNAQYVAVRDTINAQAGSSTAAPTFTSYSASVYKSGGGDVSYNQAFIAGQSTGWTSVVPGSATVRTTGPGGSSASIVDGGGPFSSVAYVDFQYLTPGTGIPATTGVSTTGFGYSFTGGTGGAATPSVQGPVAVVPGNSYTTTVPTGGSLTITFYE